MARRLGWETNQAQIRTDRTLHFVEEAQSLADARARVQVLAELWPGEYIISNRATGEQSPLPQVGNRTK
jgi:hypothetical protein